MRTSRPVPAAVVAVALAALPRPAHAAPVPGGAGAVGYLVVAGTAVGVTAVAADLGIAIQLADDGHVGHGWAVAGVLSWMAILGTDVATLVYQYRLNGGPVFDPLSTAGLVLSAGSLVLSFYGLAHPPPVTVTPAVIPTGRGKLAPALDLTVRF